DRRLVPGLSRPHARHGRRPVLAEHDEERRDARADSGRHSGQRRVQKPAVTAKNIAVGSGMRRVAAFRRAQRPSPSILGMGLASASRTAAALSLVLPPQAVSLLDWKKQSGPPIDALAWRLQVIYIQRKTLFWFLVGPVVLTAAAYLQWAVAGLPAVPEHAIAPPSAPHGFPAWLRLAHYVNLLFMVLLVRSGLQILADHPRLYWNLHCTPGSEWARFTSVAVPTDRVWTAKDDARHLSPWIGLPGYRHTIGMARHWHFLSALFWLLNGVVFIALLLSTPQWNRLVPTSWEIVPNAWKIFVHYATFHMPPEPDGYYRYNALQQLAYFGVTFVLAPLAILSGPSMSPALTNRFSWYPKLPGNRQIGRSLHFLVMCAFVMFVVVH